MSGIYEFEFTGKSALILHADDIDYTDKVAAWRKDPKNKNLSKAGDDRSPAWSWIGYLYMSGSQVVMPADNVMSCLRKAGAYLMVPGGKHGKTFKDVTQYGIIPADETFPLLLNGKPITKVSKILDLELNNDFSHHQSVAASLGFELFVKRVPVGQKKHIRVRPRFDKWSVKGTLHVTEDSLTEPVMLDILNLAGDRCGLGDWRPSTKTPGPYGRFSVTLKKVG